MEKVSCHTRRKGVGEMIPNVTQGEGGILKRQKKCHVLFEWPFTNSQNLKNKSTESVTEEYTNRKKEFFCRKSI